MAREINFLSGKDVEILRRVVHAEMHRYGNTTQRPAVPDEIGEAPGTYIALTPASGIPALISVGTGTFVGTGLPDLPTTGTGSNVGFDDVPGYAYCTVYRILYTNRGVPELRPVSNFQQLVYNLSDQFIPGDQWIIIEKDAWGSWLAMEPGLQDVSSQVPILPLIFC